MTEPVSRGELQRLGRAIEARLPDYLADLERLVNVDCGSYTKAGVDEVATWVAQRLMSLGATVTRHPNEAVGDTIVGVFEGQHTSVGGHSSDVGPTRVGGPARVGGHSSDVADGRGIGASVLLIGHMDTVFEPGTAVARPFAVRDGRAYGPGVSDMKAGLLTGLYALDALRAVAPEGADAWLPVGRVVFVANPDEEIGSPASTPVIRDLARDADVALVLEGARANGDLVSSRKGMLDVRLRLHGRAAHAGIEPETGRSAVLEAAHKIVALHDLNGRWPGVTVNAGAVDGGTRPNVVAEGATISIDIRALERNHLEAAEAAVREIASRSAVPDVTTDVEIMARHWPMEKSMVAQRLVDQAVGLAAGLGFELKDAATGGASDANTTAGLGVPSLDGLGPVGGLDHAPGEYIELGSVVPRTTLLAGLLVAIGRSPR